MPVARLQIQGFRCLESVDVELGESCTLVFGDNASGKTSFLEAFAFLSRGRSFRGAPVSAVVAHEADDLMVRAVLDDGRTALAIQNGKSGLQTRSGLEVDVGLAELSSLMPLQIIDPEIHELVAGGPEGRRRFVDWIAFHVEHEFVDAWRDFKRALKQRNALLRSGGRLETLRVWDAQYIDAAMRVDSARRRTIDGLGALLEVESKALLGDGVAVGYLQGWPDGMDLEGALTDSLERDRREMTTHRGPHRAELRIRMDDRQAKRLVSRGQQKLLACSLILAGCRLVQDAVEPGLVLLVDDLVAELDKHSQRKLRDRCFALGAQLVLTSLEETAIAVPPNSAVFHVEHGVLSKTTAKAEVAPAAEKGA